jgi:hypothetical protein
MSISAPELDPRRRVIAAFARDTLGCGCPTEVFDQIQESQLDLPGLPGPARRIAIGGRLLIYLVAPADLEVTLDHLAVWVAMGRAERDALGMNRLRLTIATDHPEALSARLQTRFDALPELDGRLHLHVLPSGAVAWITAPRADPCPH